MKTARHKNRIELLQGTLDLLILEQLRWAPSHGYDLSRAIRAHSGEVLCVDAGSLYPALHRLERQRLVRAQWAVSERKQRTRVYRLTPLGRRYLAGERSKWEQLSAAIAGVLNRSRSSEV
jgi:PadR family transcriptional regulator PadR